MNPFPFAQQIPSPKASWISKMYISPRSTGMTSVTVSFAKDRPYVPFGTRTMGSSSPARRINHAVSAGKLSKRISTVINGSNTVGYTDTVGSPVGATEGTSVGIVVVVGAGDRTKTPASEATNLWVADNPKFPLMNTRRLRLVPSVPRKTEALPPPTPNPSPAVSLATKTKLLPSSNVTIVLTVVKAWLNSNPLPSNRTVPVSPSRISQLVSAAKRSNWITTRQSCPKKVGAGEPDGT
mmetsp:Transcript_26270/g.61071  ORF Transcript_26270/g.61071 Transcript_26270/m.61071 type:complete len:238 (+) Transcript_26270:2359-3072(+)